MSDSATLIAAAEGEKATSEPASQQKDDDTENPGKQRRFFLNISLSMLEAVLALDCARVGWPLAFFEGGFDLCRLFCTLDHYDGSRLLLHLHAWLHHHGLLLHGLHHRLLHHGLLHGRLHGLTVCIDHHWLTLHGLTLHGLSLHTISKNI